MYCRTVYNIIPFGIQKFVWNSDISLLSVCLVIDNMCVPAYAVYWVESSVKNITSGADILEGDRKKKPFVLGTTLDIISCHLVA